MNTRDIGLVHKSLRYIGELKTTLKEFDYSSDLFASSSTFKNSVCMCLLQIGEFAGNFSDDFKSVNSDVPWSDIKGFRNVLAHHYGTVDLGTTWNTVTVDIPVLEKRLRDIEIQYIKDDIANGVSKDIYNFYVMRSITLGRKNESDVFKRNHRLIVDMLETKVPVATAYKAVEHSKDFSTNSFKRFKEKSLDVLSNTTKFKALVKPFVDSLER